MTSSRELGDRWERLAESFLNKQGLKTVCRNYQCKMGEIDLIMQDGNCLVFTEVRYRRNPDFGSGAETVTRSKQLRIIRTALRYLQHHDRYSMHPCRFDVLSMGHVRGELDIDWIRSAFTSA